MAEGSQRSPQDYVRPHDPWVCGDNACGAPCPTGPTRWGVCQAGSACEPRQRGDRWVCNRSAVRGGPCELGPSPHGECRIVHSRCQPRRALRRLRGHWTTVAVVAVLGLMAVWLTGPDRPGWLAPGQLTSGHSQLLDPDGGRRCQACHEAGELAVTEWLAAALGWQPAATNGTQSARCLNCHRDRLPLELALRVHSLPAATLHRWTEDACRRHAVGRRPTTGVAEAAPLACATCHREHHGRRHELAAMTDRQCQSCHALQFTSFATGHPEFDTEPDSSRSALAFGHRTHQQRHFPATAREFACEICHARDSVGEPGAPSFAACATCHAAEIDRSLSPGVAILHLPIVDVDALGDAGHDIGVWPAAATGDFDGRLPLPLVLLLQLDPAASDAVRQLGWNVDLFRPGSSRSGPHATRRHHRGGDPARHSTARNAGANGGSASVDRCDRRPLAARRGQSAVRWCAGRVLAGISRSVVSHGRPATPPSRRTSRRTGRAEAFPHANALDRRRRSGAGSLRASWARGPGAGQLAQSGGRPRRRHLGGWDGQLVLAGRTRAVHVLPPGVFGGDRLVDRFRARRVDAFFALSPSGSAVAERLR